MSARTAATLAAVLLSPAGCGGGDGGGGGNIRDALEVQLAERNASGITGTAMLAPKGEQTNVVVEMIQPFDIDPQPVGIYRGTCADLEAQPVHALPNLEDGVGGADVDASLDELKSGGYAIDVRKSVAEADVSVACGEIK